MMNEEQILKWCQECGDIQSTKVISDDGHTKTVENNYGLVEVGRNAKGQLEYKDVVTCMTYEYEIVDGEEEVIVGSEEILSLS